MWVFHGDDTYTSYQAAKRKLAELDREEIKIVEADEFKSLAQLLQLTDTVGMFNSGAKVMLKRLSGNSNLANQVAARLDELTARPIVIWEDRKADSRQSLWKKMQQSKLAYQYDLPKQNEWSKWLTDYAKQEKLKLTNSMVMQLAETLPQDRWQISNEVEKMVLFQETLGHAMTDAEFAQITGLQAVGDIWKFVDAFAQGDSKTLVQQLKMLNREGDKVQYLLAMLRRELSILFKVKIATQSGENPSNLGLHPFVVDKTKRKLQRLNWADLQRMYSGLLRLDIAIKEGKVGDNVGLLTYLLTMQKARG